MASSISASPLSKVAENTKAASPYVNIGCQCSPLTFQDQYGAIQGNCRSADSTGARWCYVDSAHTQVVRTLDSVPGSQTTHGHMRPVPLLCQDMLLQFQLLPRHPWLPSPHQSLTHTQFLHTLSKVELSPLEQVMVDSMATLVLLILVLSSHTVNIFQNLPTEHQEAAVTLSNFKI